MSDEASSTDYLLYGLAVRASRPLPGLEPAEPGRAPDVRLRLGALPPGFAAAPLDPKPWHAAGRAAARPGDEPALRIHRTADRRWYRLRYADGTVVAVDAAGAEVGCTWPPALTLEDAATYLLGPVCGFLLRLRGIPSLHASVVALGGAAIAICGPAGAGKSTTAAAFAARGAAVLGDDVAPLEEADGGVHVRPAYPQLRLWPDAVRALYGEGASLPALTPNWDKRYLPLAGAAFRPEPLPLAAVYVLAGREAEGAPRLEPVPGAEALLTLVANVYMGWLPDPAARARDFALLGALAASVPVLRAVPHADARRLPDLCALIETDALGRMESEARD